MVPVSPCPRFPDVHYDSAAKVGPRPDLASQKDSLNVDLGRIADTFRGVQVVLPPGGVPGNVIQLTHRLESAYTDLASLGCARHKRPAGTTEWRWTMAWRRTAAAATAIVTGLTVLGVVFSMVVDWTWFEAIGYLNVFWAAHQPPSACTRYSNSFRR
jgi:hypothetical protein